jgi:ABC-type antimicrobial peptide transport system permease subunit
MVALSSESDWSEAGAQGVIVSDNLARRLFADDDPLGHTLTVRMTRGGDETVTVVGVAADARLQGVDVDPQMVVYRTLAASQVFGLTGVLRIADASDTGLESHITNALRKAVPDLPAPSVTPLSDRLDSRIAEQRLFARLLAILSTLAVILAAVGLYGVIAYTIAERTREIGIRMALGAESGSIVRHVLGQAGWLVAVGTLLGLGAAIALSRILESRLFGVSPLDTGTYMAAVALFSGTALIACLAPVRAATRVDPMVALRSD